MTKINLFNKGERKIITAEGDIGPKGHKTFSAELAERLLGLYPEEVVRHNDDIVEETEGHEDEDGGDGEDETPKASELKKLKKEQLQQLLVDDGIPFETDANKDRLIELYLTAKGELGDDGEDDQTE